MRNVKRFGVCGSLIDNINIFRDNRRKGKAMRPIDADALIVELESRAEACHRDFNRTKHKVEKDMLMEAHVGYIKLIGIVKAMPTVDLET